MDFQRTSSPILFEKSGACFATKSTSRLIDEEIQVRLYAEHLEVWYGQRCLETIPRLRGEGKHRIQYRHIIDWLVRKPGAFENYRYREELFPTHRFRMAYDGLRRRHPSREAKEYLGILHLAARENEAAVDAPRQRRAVCCRERLGGLLKYYSPAA